jgi:hypothetical protein
MGGLEAALTDWQGSQPPGRGGILTVPRMLAYALFLRKHIFFNPFTGPVNAQTPISL